MHFDIEAIWRSKTNFLQFSGVVRNHFLGSRWPLNEIPQVGCLSRSGVNKSVSRDGLKEPRSTTLNGNDRAMLWYVLLDYFTTRQSFKNLYDPFLTKWPEMIKCVCIWNIPSGGRSKIKNPTDWTFFYVFNFSSATRGCFPNVYTYLASLATWLKKCHTDFWAMVWLYNNQAKHTRGSVF